MAGNFVTWMRSAVDEYDHAVSDELAVIGMRGGLGEYEALCGHMIEVTPMTVENGPHCAPCWSLVQAERGMALVGAARPRREWLDRILHI